MLVSVELVEANATPRPLFVGPERYCTLGVAEAEDAEAEGCEALLVLSALLAAKAGVNESAIAVTKSLYPVMISLQWKLDLTKRSKYLEIFLNN